MVTLVQAAQLAWVRAWAAKNRTLSTICTGNEGQQTQDACEGRRAKQRDGKTDKRGKARADSPGPALNAPRLPELRAVPTSMEVVRLGL